jgi:hypothetical protein
MVAGVYIVEFKNCWTTCTSNRRGIMEKCDFSIHPILSRSIDTIWETYGTWSFWRKHSNIKMSGNWGNQGRRRPHSPWYCDTSITVLNATEDSIRQMQTALDEDQRTVTTLCAKRDEAQNRARIWERDLMILYKDHRRLQASFNRLTLRFIDLQARIS